MNSDSANASAQSLPCQPSKCDESIWPGELVVSLERALDEIVPQLRPTHLFASSGWRGSDIGCLLDAYVKKNPEGAGKTWVITHPHIVVQNEMVPLENAPQSCNAAVFDRYMMTLNLARDARFYIDILHVLSSLNEEFNHRLADTICGEIQE